ncbi:MFS transporter [Streptomyces sp. NPDC048277]|uniref:MFS transporter n=1 Tax=Streptomyces sp. NPDC048277 TaxID=3155027 RepID=UPI00340974A1
MAVIPGPAPAGAPYESSAAQAHASDEPHAPAGTAYVWLLTIAQLGVYMALVTPLGLSLSIQVSRLAPHHEEYLGYVTGVGGLVAVVVPPVVGRLSDRTRSRLGRRRPYLAAATVVGGAALVVLAEAPDLLVLGLGWAMAQLGWGTVVVLLLASQADRLPTDQRGKVSGLVGVVIQLAPVLGVLIAGSLPDNNLLLFLAPGVLGVLGMALFVGCLREPDHHATRPVGERLSRKSLVAAYMFSPRENPDFAWNWLGKFLVMFGLSLTSTFTAFFLADRQHVSVHDVARTVAALSGGSIVCAIAGAAVGGLLSDRLRKRRIFTLVGACAFAAGSLVMALAPSVPVIFAGALLSNLGVGLFSAVDQALALDVLPDRDTDAGRYTGIYNFATMVPQATAPLIAPLILSLGADDGDKDYTLLYLVAAAFTLAGGLVVMRRVKSVR